MSSLSNSPGLNFSSAWSSWPRRLAAVVLVAFVIAIVTSAQASALLAAQGSEPPLHLILIRHLSLWLLLPPLTLLAPTLWKWTKAKLPTWLHLALHVVTSLLVAAVMAQFMLLVLQSSEHILDIPSSAFDLAEIAVPRLLLPGVFVYWAVCGVNELMAFLGAVQLDRRRARRAEEQAALLRDRLDLARFALLQRQIQPHFLFNTLNTVVGLLRDEDTEQSCDVMMSLADLLRATLQRRHETLVPLGREFALIRKYLTIQAARFGERVEVHWDIDDTAAPFLVPPLVLLTFVENSIEHGMVTPLGEISLTLRATVTGAEIELLVADDGPGFPASVLAGERNGTGLDNCLDRMEIVFEHDFQFELGNSEGGGASVRLRIPAVIEGSPLQAAIEQRHSASQVYPHNVVLP